jgi:hypothetical protein
MPLTADEQTIVVESNWEGFLFGFPSVCTSSPHFIGL